MFRLFLVERQVQCYDAMRVTSHHALDDYSCDVSGDVFDLHFMSRQIQVTSQRGLVLLTISEPPFLRTVSDWPIRSTLLRDWPVVNYAIYLRRVQLVFRT